MPRKPKDRGRIESQAVIVLTDVGGHIHASSHGDGECCEIADDLVKVLDGIASDPEKLWQRWTRLLKRKRRETPMPADIHCGKCQQRQIITASGLVCQCGVRPLDGHARKALAREYPEQVSKSPLDAEVFRNNAMGREHAR